MGHYSQGGLVLLVLLGVTAVTFLSESQVLVSLFHLAGASHGTHLFEISRKGLFLGQIQERVSSSNT